MKLISYIKDNVKAFIDTNRLSRFSYHGRSGRLFLYFIPEDARAGVMFQDFKVAPSEVDRLVEFLTQSKSGVFELKEGADSAGEEPLNTELFNKLVDKRHRKNEERRERIRETVEDSAPYFEDSDWK